MLANVKNKFKFFFTLFLLIPLLTSCGIESSNSATKKPSIVGAIKDNLAWYRAVDPNTSVQMYITVPTPNDYKCKPYDDLNAPARPCTFEDVNHDNSAYDDYKPELHVIFEADDFLSNKANARMVQKGKSTRHAKQASFRLKLDSKTHLFQGERTLQFNKSPYDNSRIKNKLWFDTFIGIPNFTSLRTKFVNLIIDGKSYGIFHKMEYCGKEFLINRGWDKDDNLYKAQNFTFNLSPDLALDAKGKPLYPAKFDAIIEQKRGKDRKKLVDMLTKLNSVYRNPTKFTTFFNKYFNRENYITWMAINIIVSNKDTVSQNFYLLNPKNSNIFYFTPWDYDGAGYQVNNLAKYQKGFGFLWPVPLHRAFLSIKANRDALTKKIKFLRKNYFTDAKLQEKVDIYSKIVEPFIKTAPDNRLSYQTWKKSIDNIVPQIGKNMQNYYKELGTPMPFWQTAIYTNNNLALTWGRSVDLEGDKIVYDLKIAKDLNMSDIIFQKDNIKDIPATNDPNSINDNEAITLPSGRYYMKVIAKEENNNSSYQIAFDTEFDPNNSDISYHGVLHFDVQ